MALNPWGVIGWLFEFLNEKKSSASGARAGVIAGVAKVESTVIPGVVDPLDRGGNLEGVWSREWMGM